MAVIKCKMCGGDLNLVEGASTAECEYCGSVQTIPKVDDEKKLPLFARAHRLRAACDFDKAAGVYEAIVADFPEEAEAYWGLVLCQYGIEYVDDPATAKKIPTCHRSSFDSVMDDNNFDLTLEYADSVARGVYREEAKPYLYAGRMIPALPVACAERNFIGNWGTRRFSLPILHSTAWEAADGSRVQILVNPEDFDVECRVGEATVTVPALSAKIFSMEL